MPQLDSVIEAAHLREALRQFLRQTEVVVARHKLTPQRYLLLLLIKGAPDKSQRSTVTELAVRMQLAQHTVTELAARAERAGLIRREPSAADRRVSYLKLTRLGDRLLAASFSDLETERRTLRTLVAGLGPARKPTE